MDQLYQEWVYWIWPVQVPDEYVTPACTRHSPNSAGALKSGIVNTSSIHCCMRCASCSSLVPRMFTKSLYTHSSLTKVTNYSVYMRHAYCCISQMAHMIAHLNRGGTAAAVRHITWVECYSNKIVFSICLWMAKMSVPYWLPYHKTSGVSWD